MHDLLTKINVLYNNDNDNEVYRLIEEQLKHESNDIGLWLSLAIVIVAPPHGDEEKSIACLQKALKIDENNVRALLILTYVYEHELGGIDDVLLKKIESLHAESDELNSMLKYAASWSYAKRKKNDPITKEKLLLESIQLCNKHVRNYEDLAKLYFDQGRDAEARELVKRALSNVQYIYPKDAHERDATNVNEFINERIKGIHITDENLNSIKELLNEKKPVSNR